MKYKFQITYFKILYMVGGGGGAYQGTKEKVFHIGF